MSQLREQCLSTMSISECVINYSRGPGTHSEPPHWACNRASNKEQRFAKISPRHGEGFRIKKDTILNGCLNTVSRSEIGTLAQKS